MKGAIVAATFQHWRAILTARARRYVGPVEAEDIMQEAFTRLVASDVDAHFAAAWLYTTTTRLCLDHLRARRWRDPFDVDPEAMASTAPDPEAMASTGEDHAAVALRIAALPEAQRTVLTARLAGVPFEAIASAGGIPLGTAKTRMHRAIAALRCAKEAAA